MVHSIEEAVTTCDPASEHFIIGGASVYRQFLPFTGRLYLTRVNKSFEGDVFFPEIDFSGWVLVSQEEKGPAGENDFTWSNQIWDRKK